MQRVAAVDEEPGAGCCRLGEPLQSPLASLRVTTVERADLDGEHDVVRLVIGLQDEVFDRSRRTLMRRAAICPAAAALARAMAEADRSMARMWPATSRAATARAAAPGPQPISRTRKCGASGSVFTIAARRGDKPGGTSRRVRTDSPCLGGVLQGAPDSVAAEGLLSRNTQGLPGPDMVIMPPSGKPARQRRGAPWTIGQGRSALGSRALLCGDGRPYRRTCARRLDRAHRRPRYGKGSVAAQLGGRAAASRPQTTAIDKWSTIGDARAGSNPESILGS